jgi:dolichol kinase
MDKDVLDFEIKRKLFHLSSIIFPIGYMLISKITMCAILVIITTITLYLDTSRHHNKKIKGVIEKFFGKILRLEEKTGSSTLSGSSYMALGMLISCLLFTKGLTITSWLILVISDCFAALIGMKFGTPLLNGKSFVGAMVFFVSAIFISIISYFAIGYNTSFFIIIISSFLTSFVEFFSGQLKINDNLSIPLTYCFSTVILGLI